MAGEQGDIIKFTSTRFGELEIPTSALITVVGGIIGFPNNERFALLDYNPPFSWLHSVETPDLAFVVVNGAEFGEGYRFAAPIGDRDLDLREDDDLAIMNIVTVRPDPSFTTVNLKAPVIVNLRNRRGRQLVLDNPHFPTRMNLWASQEAEKK